MNDLNHSMTATYEVITPDIAREYLKANIGVNRKLRTAKVAQYAAEMLNGNWEPTGEPIIFDEDGYMVQGQHRLSAEIVAGKPVGFLVVRGQPRDSFRVLDQGMKRNVADAIGAPRKTIEVATALMDRLKVFLTPEYGYSGGNTATDVQKFCRVWKGPLDAFAESGVKTNVPRVAFAPVRAAVVARIGGECCVLGVDPHDLLDHYSLRQYRALTDFGVNDPNTGMTPIVKALYARLNKHAHTHGSMRAEAFWLAYHAFDSRNRKAKKLVLGSTTRDKYRGNLNWTHLEFSGMHADD